jgi:hypothetical protein
MGNRMIKGACFVVVTLWLTSLAAAHTNAFHDLAGVTPCLDERSLQIVIEQGRLFSDLELNAEFAKPILRERLLTILRDYQIPWLEQTECQDENFLLSLFMVKAEEQSGGSTTYVFIASTQIGKAGESFDPFARLLENGKYDNYSSWLLFEDEVLSPDDLMPHPNEVMMRDLAASWWEDNPIIYKPFPLPQVIGLALTLVIFAGGFFVLRQRRKRKTGLLSSSYTANGH